MEACAVCGYGVEDASPSGIGTMLFHPDCLPTCRFCRRAYGVSDAGWDFRGGVAWSEDWGYVPRLESAACGRCTDDAERRDYGAGW